VEGWGASLAGGLGGDDEAALEAAISRAIGANPNVVVERIEVNEQPRDSSAFDSPHESSA
jgi:hypothetical protein